jgi:hypothetical protein
MKADATKRAAQLWASSASHRGLRLADSHLLGRIYSLPILAKNFHLTPRKRLTLAAIKLTVSAAALRKPSIHKGSSRSVATRPAVPLNDVNADNDNG